MDNKIKKEPELFQSAIDAEKASTRRSPLLVGLVAGGITMALAVFVGFDGLLPFILAVTVGLIAHRVATKQV